VRNDDIPQSESLPEIDFSAAAIIPVPEADIVRYRELLSGLDLPDAQAMELLEILWSIMSSFVELGHSVDLSAYLARLAAIDEDDTEGDADG